MRRSTIVCCLIAFGAILAPGTATAGGGDCATPANAAAAGPVSGKPKASSFAPHPGSHSHAFGTPVQAPILHRRKPPQRVADAQHTPTASPQ